MAISPAATQYLADLLSGIGSGFLQAPRGGSPFAGLGLGIQNANQLMGQRRQIADQDQERAWRAAQIARQQKMDAEADAARAQSKSGLSRLLGQPDPTATPKFVGGAGSSQTSFQQPSPTTAPPAWLTPERAAVLQSMPPDQALNIAAQWSFKEPDKPDLTTFYEGNSQYQGYLGPDGKPVRVTENSPRWQPAQPPQMPPDIIKYQYDMNQRKAAGQPTVPYQEWAKAQSGGDLRYGLNPVYGTDANGNTVLLLPDTGGGISQAKLPDGVTVAPQTQIVNTGTAQVAVDKRTGQPVPGSEPLPIDNSGKQSQETQGESQGKVAAGLPDTLAGADLALKTIEDLKSDPARTAATGMSSLVMTKIPGTPAYDYLQKVNQAKGQVFRQVYESLRGGGAITEIEGGKAEQALARLDTAQTEDGFLQALNELEIIIKTGAERAKQKAAVGPQLSPVAPPPPAAPTVPPPPPGFEVVQ
jgi:hypothetical protein